MQHKKENNVLIITLDTRLDTNRSPEFEEFILEKIENGDKHIVVDMSEVEYMSSAGIRVLLKAVKKVNYLGGGLVLCNTNDQVQQVLDISGLMSLLVSWFTLDEAIAAVSDV